MLLPCLWLIRQSHKYLAKQPERSYPSSVPGQHRCRLQVANNLENALASADPEVEKLFIGAFSDVVLDPKYLENMSEETQAVSPVQTAACMSSKLPRQCML